MRGKTIHNDTFIAFVQGRVQAQLEGLAQRSPLSYEQLALGVGEFLLTSAGRSIVGTFDNLSTLREPTPEGDKTVRPVEVASRPYRRKASQKKTRRKMSKDARARISAAMKKRWAARKVA